MVWKMKTTNPFARQRIIEVTSEMIRTTGSMGIDLGEVAEQSGVDASTVESFFDSRTQLIAEAQMANYFSMVEPLHLVLSRVESALADVDQAAFWAAVEENMEMAWSSGQVNKKWGIFNLLHDIWLDPFSQSHFCDLLDIQFDRWITVVEQAQGLGWIDADMDAKSLTAVFWAASVGQVITAGSNILNPSSEDVRDFYMRIVRGRKSP
jgi:hypothetical protein